MDLATLIGLLGAFAFLIFAILTGGDATQFYNVNSVLIVMGGSFFIVMMKFNLMQFLGAAKLASKAFLFKIEKPEQLIDESVMMADAARKGGFLALEELDITNSFMRKSVDMLVDGSEPEQIRTALMKDISLTMERHQLGADIYRKLGEVAPSMGMIGTLIGLVSMLNAMDDPKNIGPAMAVALLTTLYGAILANMVALPLADKLELRMREEALNRRLIMDAVLSIQQGQNPKIIESYLKNYLSEKKRIIKTTGD